MSRASVWRMYKKERIQLCGARDELVHEDTGQSRFWVLLLVSIGRKDIFKQEVGDLKCIFIVLVVFSNFLVNIF